MPRYWCSFTLPPMPDDDYRPLEYPPPGLLGWWCSGYGSSETGLDKPMICVLLDAESEGEARATIGKQWPETLVPPTAGAEWRFFETRDDDYVPNDRFPLDDWSPLKGQQS